MEIQQIFQIIKKRILIIILITVFSTSLAGIKSYFYTTPMYKATAALLVGKMPDHNQQNMDYSDVLMYEQLIKTYQQIAESKVVSEYISSRLSGTPAPNVIRGMLSTSATVDTQIIYLTVTDTDANMAAKIANTAADCFIQRAQEIVKANNVQVISYSRIPTAPYNIKLVLYMAIVFFIGIMASLGIVFLKEYLDNTIKGINEASEVLELPVIGTIPRFVKEK